MQLFGHQAHSCHPPTCHGPAPAAARRCFSRSCSSPLSTNTGWPRTTSSPKLRMKDWSMSHARPNASAWGCGKTQCRQIGCLSDNRQHSRAARQDWLPGHQTPLQRVETTLLPRSRRCHRKVPTTGVEAPPDAHAFPLVWLLPGPVSTSCPQMLPVTAPPAALLPELSGSTAAASARLSSSHGPTGAHIEQSQASHPTTTIRRNIHAGAHMQTAISVCCLLLRI